jgi:hypothetical protein
VAHRLAWFGDTEGALLAARSAEGTAGQEKALMRVVEALAGHGNVEAAERLAAGLKGKGPRKDAEARIASARAGNIAREPAADCTWQEMLTSAEQRDDQDDRLAAAVTYITPHLLGTDARRGLTAALLRVRQALTDGGQAIKAARLSRDLVTTCV